MLLLHIAYKLGQKSISTELPLINGIHNIEQLKISVRIDKSTVSVVQINVQVFALAQLTMKRVSIEIPYQFHAYSSIYCNGFQSWTHSEEFAATAKFDKVNVMAAPFVAPFGDYKLVPYKGKKGKLHAWTYAYIRQPLVNKNIKNNPHLFYKPTADKKNRSSEKDIVLIGSTNDTNGYTLIQFNTLVAQPNISISKDCKGLALNGNFNALNILLARGNEQSVFDLYFSHLKDSLTLPPPTTQKTYSTTSNNIAGWTSWYNYYDKINETIINDNLHAFINKKIPIEIFQIDDGWQEQVGDWLQVNHKFPNGLSDIVTKAHQAGIKAGLWLAPFVCVKQSAIYQNKKHWLLRNNKGKLLTASYNFIWQSYMYPLNFYHPEVRTYLSKVLQTVLHTWGFDMIKIDFLYAVALQAPKNKTRGQVMYEAMAWLRQLTGDKLVLGCGVPLSAAMGTTDFCRVGPDIHTSWEMPLLKIIGSRERVSTIIALKNTIHRRHLNQRAFLNDPDVSILRLSNNQLSSEQRYTVFLINQIFGAIQFVSDNINEYSPALLHLYQSQFPLRNKHIKSVKKEGDFYAINFTIDSLSYVAFCNLGPEKHTFRISKYLTKNDSRLLFNNRDQSFLQKKATIRLYGYQSICFLRVDTNQAMSIAGTTGHIFAGSEIEDFTYNDKKGLVKVQLDNKCINNTRIFIFTAQQTRIEINGVWIVTEKQQGFNVASTVLYAEAQEKSVIELG